MTHTLALADRGPRQIGIRDVSLFVDVVGHGPPLLLMHGGPGADHTTLWPFRQLADRFTLIFYDHRCNGHSTGAPLSSMTWENLTADAEALREALGFERWAVLGHSFGGHVVLEYALRHPGSISHLVLLDTGGDSRWARQNAAELAARRGASAKQVALVRRWFSGDFQPREWMPILFSIGDLYSSRPSLWHALRDLVGGGWRLKMRPEAMIFASRHLLKDWSVMDRLGQITAPALVMAGRDDFIFPPEHQLQLAAGIPNSRLVFIEAAGHNPQSEQTTQVMHAVSAFISTS
jgi:pimeloyl-ACP methyl ester carboxylesterase